MRNLSKLLVLFSVSIVAQERQKIQSTLEILEISTGKRTVIYSDTTHFEAPNWSNDGSYFVVNKSGKLYKIDRETGVWNEIPINAKLNANNDHGISPDGKSLVISSNAVEPEHATDEHTSYIYTTSIDGGNLTRVTEKSLSYWHGWSPDGATLAFVGRRNNQFDIYSIPANGGNEKQLTDTPGLDDGPDYSPDGKYIYFNSFRSGIMEIWRMDADGKNPVQLTDDKHSNWFPHPSPDGKYIVFLTFMDDLKQGHPFGKDVKLRLMDLKTQIITDLTPVFFGGQGTINVPSWSPDSKLIAFVSYKVLN
jgi:Tol biopolymer transport system component